MGSHIRVTAKMIAGLMLSAAVMLPVSGFAATKVPTQRIYVPEERNDENQRPDPTKPKDAESQPSPVEIPSDALPKLPESTSKSDDATKDKTQDDGAASTEQDKNEPPPPILRDFSILPDPVKRMRQLLLDAAHTGDIEKLRPLIGIGDTATSLSFGGLEGDPVAFLKEASGDQDGFEILAILIEVLEAGYVHVDAGTEEELYVWPYFFAWPLDKLDPRQKVELFRLLTAGDVADSTDFGAYIFYRVGITPQGRWAFFVAGD